MSNFFRVLLRWWLDKGNWYGRNWPSLLYWLPWCARTIRYFQSEDIGAKLLTELSIGFFFFRTLTNYYLAFLKIVNNHSLEKNYFSELNFTSLMFPVTFALWWQGLHYIIECFPIARSLLMLARPTVFCQCKFSMRWTAVVELRFKQLVPVGL